MARAHHLQRRRGIWHVRLRVPAALVGAAGATHLLRSLGTRDEAAARLKRAAVLAKLYGAVAALTVADGLSGRVERAGTAPGGGCDDPAPPAPACLPRRSGAGPGKAAGARPDRGLEAPPTLGDLVERWLVEEAHWCTFRAGSRGCPGVLGFLFRWPAATD